MGRLRRLRRALVPHRVRHAARLRIDAYRDLPGRVERLETLMLESHDQLAARSRERWSTAAPDTELTFGRALTGDAFVEAAERHGAFGPAKTVLEIGPGYGRLLEAATRRRVEFARWIGVDLSPRNVEHLRRRFATDARAEFVARDAETVELNRPVDTVLSSLTLKHLYPSFERALANAAAAMSAGGTVVVDLIEGERRFFQEDGQTYIRWYGRSEVTEILTRCRCELVTFDYVEHDPDHRRLLVVARRRADGS